MNKVFARLKNYFYFTTDETHSLVEKSKKGDQKSITKLFNKFKPILYNKIKNTTIVDLSKEEMEDEVLVFLTRIFMKELDKFDSSKASFGSWLSHCFNNHMLGINKRKRRVYTTGIDDMSVSGKDGESLEWNIKDDTYDIDKMTDRVPFITLVRLLYKELSPLEVRMVVDKYVYGYTEKEIEEKHNITPRTCNQRIKRAMKRLNKKVNKSFFV
jgi:RNA polymerase sigma factor (sigma-70 family)